MSDLYRGYDAGLLDASTADRAQGRQARDDFFRGVKFSPFDLLGAPVDIVNMGLQGIDSLYGVQNVLGSPRPFLGGDDLINRYADFVEYMGYDYGRPTGSLAETAGRVTGGILAPTGGAAAFGKGVDLLEAGGRAYAAGAPARVLERRGTTTLGSGIDPTAPIDDMIVARQGGVARSEDVFSEVADFPSLSKSEEQLVAASSAPPEEVAGLGRVITEPIDPKNMAASRARFNELQEMTSGYEQERAKARIVKLDDGTDAIQYMEPPATVQTVSIADLKATQPGLLTGGDAALTEGPPLVVKKGGELFVRDGHHRLARMIEAGADTVDVRVVDLDAGGLLGVEPDAPASIRAYHGSPHDFAPAVRVLDTETGETYVQEAGDPILTGLMAQNPGRYEIIEENPLGMFDLSKMGTGEGAQAYGEGAYLSGSEDIAKGYRDALSRDKGTIGGIAVDTTRNPEEAVSVWREASKDLPAELQNLVASKLAARLNVDEILNDMEVEFFGEYLDEVKDILTKSPGKMYEAEIKVGPEELLDYDKPFHAQTPDIKKRMRDMVEDELTRDDAINLGFEESNPSPYFEFGYDIDDGVVVDMGAAREFMLRDDMTVDEFLGNWQAIRGSTDAGEFLLRKYGIPGLKYKAAGSRTPGMDEADIDRNYVIFDENIINILRKYGLLAPLVGGGTAAAVMGADEPQAAGGIL